MTAEQSNVRQPRMQSRDIRAAAYHNGRAAACQPGDCGAVRRSAAWDVIPGRNVRQPGMQSRDTTFGSLACNHGTFVQQRITMAVRQLIPCSSSIPPHPRPRPYSRTHPSTYPLIPRSGGIPPYASPSSKDTGPGRRREDILLLSVKSTVGRPATR